MAVKPDKKGKVTGTKNADKITWVSSADWKKALTVNAGAGNDTVDFKKSTYSNTINGEAGNDTIYGGTVGDMIRGGAGADKLYGYNGKDSIYGDAGKDTIYGGNGDDYLNGGNDNDVIYGEAGTDTIMGGDGDDSLYGGDGIDSIVGGNGNDYIEGGAGFGRLFGLVGNDIIKGGKDKDTIDGGDGNDTLYGGSESDTVKGNMGDDLIYGEDGDDFLYGMNDNDTIYGGKGNDLLDGSSGNDSLMGEDGNDVIRAGAGNDYANGGSGNDTIQGQSGDDTIYGGSGDDYLEGNDGADKVYGQAGKDLIRGGNGNDYLDGGDDNDTIQGQSGNNTILGGNGNDSIEGGSGNDSIDGGNGADKIYGQDGNDTIKAGAGNDYIEGGNGDDVIYGQSGNNTLLGGAGNDKIIAGTGNDRINAGAGTNSIQFTNNSGTNTILNGGGTDTVVLTSVSNLDNIQTSWSNNDLVIQTGNTQIVLDRYAETDNHSVKYIQAGSTKKSINDVLPATPYEQANMYMGTDGNDTIVQTFGSYKDGVYDKQNLILRTEFDVTDEWLNKYRYDLSYQASTVSENYEDVKDLLQDIKTYEHCVNDYYNPNYTGDTYFRKFDINLWQSKLDEANENAYGLSYVWENYRTSELAGLEEGTTEYETAENNLQYSQVYAKYKNAVDNLERYQGYADGTLAVPTFRDMAGDKGVQYWIDKRDAVQRNIDGFTGSKQIFENLLEDYAQTDSEFAELLGNYKVNPDTYQGQYDEAVADIIQNNAEIATAYNTYQTDLARYNLYREYATNYFNDEYLGEGYVSDDNLDGKTYDTFRQEAVAEAKVLNDYNLHRYRYQTGQEYWSTKAQEAYKIVNGYQGSLSLMNEFYLRSYGGDSRNIYYDRYREYKNEFWDNYDDYYRFDAYVTNWEDDTYIGYQSADHSDDVFYSSWDVRVASTQLDLNGQVSEYEESVARLDKLVNAFVTEAPSDLALQIVTHPTTAGAGGIILAGDGNADITIGRLDTTVNPSYGDVFAMGQGGNDTYKLTSIADLIIDDFGGNDSYTLNNIKKGSNTNIITDSKGADK